MRKQILLSLSIAITLLSFGGLASISVAADVKESADQKQESEIRQVLAGLSDAASSSDAPRVAAAFAEDGILIDEEGQETRGRKALQERFDTAFKQRNGAASVSLHPGKISFPASNVAIIVGEVSRKEAGTDLPASRFSMVMVKQNNTWLINEATETQMQGIKSSERLRQLDWLIGNWQVKKSDGSSIKLKVDWDSNHNFIHSKCINASPSSTGTMDEQVIGWDPRKNTIVSWHFDSNGGFGYGKWLKESDHWTVEFAGVSPSGANMRANNVFTPKSPDEFTWQSIFQSADGTALPDTDLIKVTREK